MHLRLVVAVHDGMECVQVLQSAYAQAQAVRRSLASNSLPPVAAERTRQSSALYIVLDHRLVLPEYVVEYELV